MSGTSTLAVTATISAARASSAIARWSGVGGSLASATSRPRRPISVSSPSATTTPSPTPATTAVPACSSDDRSASGASGSTGSRPFAAATGSPVSLDSSAARPSASTTRASAATTLPASTSSTSPITSASTGTRLTTPARRTSAVGALRSRSACSARFARISEIVSTALTSPITTKIAIASRSSPKIADSTPTAISSSWSGSTSDSISSPRTAATRLPSARTAVVPRRRATSGGVSPLGRLPKRSHRTSSDSACAGTTPARSAGVALAMQRMIRLLRNRGSERRVWDDRLPWHASGC